MFYKTEFSPRVEKEARKISQPDLKIIRRHIQDRLCEDPYHYGKPLGFSLKGSRSMRVGDYRVIYRIVEDTIYIEAIDKRAEVYGGH